MQHAARFHIIGFINQNPSFARKMSEKLEEILKRFSFVEVLEEPIRVRSSFVKGYETLTVKLHPAN